MGRDEILQRINAVAAQHFNNSDLVISEETTAADVPGWDSLAHIQFLMEVENALNIRFKSSEVGSLANVGELVSRVEAKFAS